MRMAEAAGDLIMTSTWPRMILRPVLLIQVLVTATNGNYCPQGKSHWFHWIFWSILSGCHCSASRLVCGGWAERVSIFPSTKWVKIWFDELRQQCLFGKVDSINVSGCPQVSEPLSPCQSQAITSNIWGRHEAALYSHHDLCLQYRGSSGLQ